MAYAAPLTPLQQLLAEIWQEVLGIERAGLDDNFFDLGGDSILATRIVARLRAGAEVDLSVRAVFEAPILADLAERLEAALGAGRGAAVLPIHPVPREQPLPLSFAQQRLWFLDRLEPGNPSYNIPAALRLEGPLDVQALRQALEAIVERHESLRTTFPIVDGLPVQVIQAPARRTGTPDEKLDSGDSAGGWHGQEMSIIDLSALPHAEREEAAQRRAAEAACEPFDLARGPLRRASLLKLGEQDHVLLLSFHHIVSDGWSTEIFLRELAALYAAFREGRPSPLPDLPIQYADFAAWQRQWLVTEGLASQIAYWKRELAGAPPLDLPVDRPRPRVPTYRGAREKVAVDPALLRRLRDLGRRHGATLFMTLLAAFQTLLHRHSGQEDLSIGFPIAGRRRVEIEGLIGFFANTLVIRCDLSDDPGFIELLSRVRRSTLDAYVHQDVPFEKIVEEIQPERDQSRQPLFQVMLVLQNTAAPAAGLAGLSAEFLEVGAGTSKFDLTLSLADDGRRLEGMLEYSTDLFDAVTIRRLADHLDCLLREIVADPARRLSELPLATQEEQEHLQMRCSGAALEASRATQRGETGRLIHERIEDQARRRPDAVAVAFRDERLTYRELDLRAGEMARRLRGRIAGPASLIGLCVERSPEMVVGILAILKAGGAYVPLDPSWPAARLAFALADTQAAVVVSQTSLLERLPKWDGRVLLLDEERQPDACSGSGLGAEAKPSESRLRGAGPGDLAYLIYTSGSSGQPKGVAVTHRNLLYSTLARPEFYRETPDVFLLLPSFAFDSSVAGLFWTLSEGGTLVLPEKGSVYDPPRLGALVARHRVTHWLSVPALYDALLAHALPGDLGSLRTVIVAGETCPSHLPERHRALVPHARLFNEYGPTETTVWCTAFEATAAGRAASIPIGRPIPGAKVYVVDRRMRLAPAGVPGEIGIGGPGVACGYYRRPDLTSEKFVPDPFDRTPEARLYLTGDMGRWLPDGSLQFLGRRDGQVKVRGFRIETGEIEAALARHPDVEAAAVVVRSKDTSGNRLAAFIVPRNRAPLEPAELKRFLGACLPDPMVPGLLRIVEALPRTPSGKTDRRSLASMPIPEGESETGRTLPRDGVEHRLAAIWRELLGVDLIGVEDRFFALGGHSLLAVDLIGRIEKELGRRLPLAALFRDDTLAGLASILRRPEEAEAIEPPSFSTPEAFSSRASVLRLQSSGSGTPLFFVHPVGGMGICYATLAHRLGRERPFFALESPGLVADLPDGVTVEALAGAYLESIRRIQPKGPYLLGGWSFGGVVAFEMASCLARIGEKTALLALVDSRAPDPGGGFPHLDEEAVTSMVMAEMGQAQVEILDRSLLKRIERIVRGHVQALRCYTPGRYPGRVCLLRATGLGAALGDPAHGWRDFAKAGVDVHDVAADHYDIVREPAVRVVAQVLRGWCRATVRKPHAGAQAGRKEHRPNDDTGVS
ncbi:MAG TPA: amino acid adenylation domain-containing protein [Candidatus Polarisedimenticolia bacterium]|nr:amino acid adenylation domain-containing protein [Candidatus Polarisedimenticolia bacterium]